MARPAGFIVYTTEVGGPFRAITAVKADFDAALTSRRLVVGRDLGLDADITVIPSYMVWCPVGLDFDFLLGKGR